MTQLTIGMYGGEFDFIKSLFGLRCGQLRSDGTHNSGWYNKSGEKLGFGDLSGADIARIASELEDGEIFITLSEGDSYWECKNRGVSESAPGTNYIAEYAILIIARGYMYCVTDYDCPPARTMHLCGAEFQVITRAEATSLIKTGKL